MLSYPSVSCTSSLDPLRPFQEICLQIHTANSTAWDVPNIQKECIYCAVMWRAVLPLQTQASPLDDDHTLQNLQTAVWVLQIKLETLLRFQSIFLEFEFDAMFLGIRAAGN